MKKLLRYRFESELILLAGPFCKHCFPLCLTSTVSIIMKERGDGEGEVMIICKFKSNLKNASRGTVKLEK